MSSENITLNRDFYQSLPKIELHRHLEGSLRVSSMAEVAQKYQLDLPYEDEQKFRSLVQVLPSDPYHFQNFLSKFATLRKFYQSPETIRRFAREAVQDAAQDNIRYLELRFTPVALTRIRDYPLGEAMDWVIEAVSEGGREFGVETALIASVNRHESIKLADEVIGLAVDRLANGIVGVDLAGSESDFPGEEFAEIFLQAEQSGMRVTIHAGEWGGPEIIQLAINALHAERIGHGVRVMEDARVIDLAKERGITFEVCPTSNFQSGVVNILKDHPLPKMIESGLTCTLNTDDPGISRIDLSDEIQVAIDEMGFSLDGLKKLTQNAIQAAFIAEDKKLELSENVLAEFTKLIKE